jgi:hypothetical protein
MQDIVVDRTLGTTGMMTISNTDAEPRVGDTGEGIAMSLDGSRMPQQTIDDSGIVVRAQHEVRIERPPNVSELPVAVKCPLQNCCANDKCAGSMLPPSRGH